MRRRPVVRGLASREPYSAAGDAAPIVFRYHPKTTLATYGYSEMELKPRVQIALAGLLAALLLAACGSAASSIGASIAVPTATAYDVNGIHRVYSQPKLIQGHAWTLFVGGQFCPFCASMRWPFVKALGRFGTFSGLGEMHSQVGVDGFNFSIPTYDFVHMTYTSSYITLRTVEIADASGNPLQTLDDDETDLFNHLDPNGSIPFVFVGGTYVAQLPYSPLLLQGHSYSEIAAEVNSGTPGQLGQAVNAEADALTAALCTTDGAQPASVCAQPAIQALMHRLAP